MKKYKQTRTSRNFIVSYRASPVTGAVQVVSAGDDPALKVGFPFSFPHSFLRLRSLAGWRCGGRFWGASSSIMFYLPKFVGPVFPRFFYISAHDIRVFRVG